MTCFWDGILSKLPNNVISVRFGNNVQNDKNAFITAIKTHAVTTIDVLWNNEPMSEQLMQEHLTWILEYNINGIYGGHDCSICDPFLAQICQLFNINIIHNYTNTVINYTNKRISNTTLTFYSDTGHFW